MVQPVSFPRVDSPQTPVNREVPNPRPTAAKGSSFEGLIGEAIDRVDGQIAGADDKVADFLQGRSGIQEMAMSLEQADLGLRLLVRVRNRVIEAYREVSRMNL